MSPPVVDVVQMENAPLPPPSTSRTPGPRPSPPSTYVATQAPLAPPTPPVSHPPASATSSLSPPLPDSDERSDVGLRIKGSARHKTRPTPSMTVHLAPAAAEPTGSDLANLVPSPDLVPAAGPAPTTTEQAPTERKRKTPPDGTDSDDQGPLLSDYMCPICFSPPKSAIITPCGHILCGSCLHGAITARPAASQALCPVCRTPIPNLQFTMPAPASGTPQPPVAPPRMTSRHVPPASRNIPGGFRLPTRGEDMVDLDAREEVIDVDATEHEPQPERWDPARSGVIGLEILTLGNL